MAVIAWLETYDNKGDKMDEKEKKSIDFIQACFDWCKEHMTLLKGLGAFVVGIVFICMTLKSIVSITMFLSGLFLIYYGLLTLGLTQITTIVDTLVGRIVKK